MFLYDFIIAGGGASGLMLAYRMSKDAYFDDKSVLIIDKDEKNTNDRTWCYWEKGTGEWDHLLTKSWHKIYFGSTEYSETIDLLEYTYKMLRSADLYLHLKSEILKKSNFKFINDHIQLIEDNGLMVHITTDARNYIAKKVFSSIFDVSILTNQTSYPYLKQHFVGWFIKAKLPIFDENVAGFMDFDIPQYGNTRFMYVLPTSRYEALVEYTLFSEELLDFGQYEAAIKNYIQVKFKLENYIITEKEQGNIPMTCYPFSDQNTSNLMFIGSAGGWTKASTGFTFANTTRYSSLLLQFLKEDQNLKNFNIRNRYWMYDLIFLDVLHKNNALGSKIFTSIFANNEINKVLNFLDEKGSILDDFSIMTKTKPTINFMISGIMNLKQMIL